MVSIRARRPAPGPERAKARNLRSAAEHRSSSALQLSTDFASARILASTPRHFAHNSPSGARKVNSPNGSSLVGGAATAAGGTSLMTSDRVSAEGSADANWTPPDLARDWLSGLANTAFVVKKRTR